MRMAEWGLGLVLVLLQTSPTFGGDDAHRDEDHAWRHRREDVVVFERNDFRRQVRQLDRYIEEAMNEPNVGKRTRLLQGARREVEGLRLRMEERESKRPLPPPPPGPPARAVIADRELGDLCEALKQEAFGKDKLRILSAAVPSQSFDVSQVQRILGHFDLSGEKLDAVRVLKGRVVDTENYYKLYSAFEFSSDKEKLKTVLGI